MSVNNISFILHKPQLSENIGACARGMKNFIQEKQEHSMELIFLLEIKCLVVFPILDLWQQ